MSEARSARPTEAAPTADAVPTLSTYREWRDATGSLGPEGWSLGVAICNVAAGTTVVAPRAGTVIDADFDPRLGGGRVVLRLNEPHDGAHGLLLAHLGPDSLAEIGQVLEAGEVVGRVGTTVENGGWFQHVHVQLLTDFLVDSSGWRLVDAPRYTRSEDTRLGVDPTGLIARPRQ